MDTVPNLYAVLDSPPLAESNGNVNVRAREEASFNGPVWKSEWKSEENV